MFNFFGQVSKYDKQKLQNYWEIGKYIQHFGSSKQVRSKNYKTTANLVHMSQKIGQVSKYDKKKLQINRQVHPNKLGM